MVVLYTMLYMFIHVDKVNMVEYMTHCNAVFMPGRNSRFILMCKMCDASCFIISIPVSYAHLTDTLQILMSLVNVIL